MRKIWRITGLLLAVLILSLGAYLLLWPVPIDPVEYHPSENPGTTGVFAPNRALAGIERLAEGMGVGPEDVTLGPDGRLYAGLLDGRIVRLREGASETETVADTGGRPLGMQFDSAGNLIVADADKGLLSVSPQGKVTVLVDRVEGEPIRFANDLDIARDGTIWFSDSSRRFGVDQWTLDFLEMRPGGRLLSYDPATAQTSVRLDGLYFANGVALGPEEAFVLVDETPAARIRRLWLKGPQAGTSDIFLDRLPAYPDNLSFNGQGIFWVALPARRLDEMERLWPHPWLRKLILRLSSGGSLPMNPYGWVIGVDGQGKVVRNLQDPSGGYSPITSVNQFGDQLYFGSIVMSSVGRIPVP